MNERKHYDDSAYLDYFGEALDALTSDPTAFAEVVDAALDASPGPFLAFYRSFRPFAWRHTRQTDAERLWDVLNATLNRMADETANAEMARLDAMAEV